MTMVVHEFTLAGRQIMGTYQNPKMNSNEATPWNQKSFFWRFEREEGMKQSFNFSTSVWNKIVIQEFIDIRLNTDTHT